LTDALGALAWRVLLMKSGKIKKGRKMFVLKDSTYSSLLSKLPVARDEYVTVLACWLGVWELTVTAWRCLYRWKRFWYEHEYDKRQSQDKYDDAHHHLRSEILRHRNLHSLIHNNMWIESQDEFNAITAVVQALLLLGVPR